MKTLIYTIIIVLLAGGAYYLFKNLNDSSVSIDESSLTPPTTIVEETPVTPPAEQPAEVVNEKETVVGSSVDGRDITAYHYGNGSTELLFIGGIHGGYEWNTVLVAYELMDYLDANPDVIPENVKVTVIPVLNPDGLYKVVGSEGRFDASSVPATEADTVPGRFNANSVDLNRNFDCDWQPTGTWQNKSVSGGSIPFSEPESQALKKYVETNEPAAVVVWYSAVGGVFASNCHNGILPETRTLTNVYANASGYKAYEEFNFYEITGDAVNWLAKNSIPAISVLLTTHQDTEWSKNKAGVEALLKHYAQ